MDITTCTTHDDQFNVFIGDTVVAHVYNRRYGVRLSLTPAKRHADQLGQEIVGALENIERTVWDRGADIVNAIKAQVERVRRKMRNPASANYLSEVEEPVAQSKAETRYNDNGPLKLGTETSAEAHGRRRGTCTPAGYDRL